MIDSTTPLDVSGVLTRGNVTIDGLVTEFNEEDGSFVFLTEEIELNLDASDWDFRAPPKKPKPGWYSHTEYPVELGANPVWVDSEGRAYTFVLGNPDPEGNVKALHYLIEAKWEDLVPLEKEGEDAVVHE